MRAIPRPQPQAALLAHGLLRHMLVGVSMETACVKRGDWFAIYANAVEHDQRMQPQAEELCARGKDAVADDLLKRGVLAIAQAGRCSYERATLNFRWDVLQVVRVEPLDVQRGWPVGHTWTLQPEEVDELRRRWVAAKNKAA